MSGMNGMSSRSRGFTGRHMAFSMIAFFGVIIGVNMTMATVATRTFGGKVVENSYVASQKFNGWLAEARAQQAAGWTADLGGEGGRVVAVTKAGGKMRGVAAHPLGRTPDMQLSFREEAPGRYVSHQLLPAGRWRVRVQVREGGETASFMEDVRL